MVQNYSINLKSQIAQELLIHPRSSQRDLLDRLIISKSTLYHNLNGMIQNKIIVINGKNNSHHQGGRRPQTFSINHELGIFILVLIQQHSLKIRFFDFAGKLLRQKDFQYSIFDIEIMLEQLSQVIDTKINNRFSHVSGVNIYISEIRQSKRYQDIERYLKDSDLFLKYRAIPITIKSHLDLVVDNINSNKPYTEYNSNSFGLIKMDDSLISNIRVNSIITGKYFTFKPEYFTTFTRNDLYFKSLIHVFNVMSEHPDTASRISYEKLTQKVVNYLCLMIVNIFYSFDVGCIYIYSEILNKIDKENEVIERLNQLIDFKPTIIFLSTHDFSRYSMLRVSYEMQSAYLKTL
ncbi:hypothetical protein [Leuconostoc pseudomesenteroides]|uniref:hypothetical protein n=1 Tax=Leuconostoc pseudomesenteroides TaxID=33968 RepID=UPI00228679DF|nr:hypothetical protein [Leuconostoc pseudomesenteroides]WAM37645.1 hypothetical protein OYT93_05385 [Leuconostoc pseudomesenteroides]